MRSLSYEQVRDITDMAEAELTRLGQSADYDKEVFNRMGQEATEDGKKARKIQRLLDILNIFSEELSVVNFSFGFGGKQEHKPSGTGLIYDVSASNEDTKDE